MKVSLYLFVALMTISLFSCKKNDDNKDCKVSEANLVGTYKIGSIKYKLTPTSPEVDGSSELDACELDDLLNFKADSTLIYTDAGVKCDEPGDFSGKWSLKGNILTINGSVNTISSFDCSGLSLSQSDYDIDGDLFTITLKKQ